MKSVTIAVKVLREIASERPVYERAASAFYRVRRKAKQALRAGGLSGDPAKVKLYRRRLG
jgi:hypothetical protein